MTDCSSIQGSTSSSSDAMSSRGGSNNSAASIGSTNHRVRIIRMIRPNARRIILGPESSIGYGFSIRGGKEFGTGFFVSNIDKGSEADLSGLKIGDQIIRVNGYHVADATHKELKQFITCQDRLTLKVRGVGMLPIKEKSLDPLTWHIVPRHTKATTLSGLDEQLSAFGKCVRIVLRVAPKTKLGLGICKGPEWKPGIFVQFTKDFSVAKESGLRPGDQILSCNSIDFSDVLFSEAVAVMKSSNILEMIVRTGAGLDLFPGESSGYNSCASSIRSDQSVCYADPMINRYNMIYDQSPLNQRKHREAIEENRRTLDRRKTISDIPNSDLGLNTKECNKTIIEFSNGGTFVNNKVVNNASEINDNNLEMQPFENIDNLILRPVNNQFSSFMQQPNTNSTNTNQKYQPYNYKGFDATIYDKTNNRKIADICLVSRQIETKTITVEVHRDEDNENSKDTNLHKLPVKQQQQQQQDLKTINDNYSSLKRQTNSGTTNTKAPPPPPPVRFSELSRGSTNLQPTYVPQSMSGPVLPPPMPNFSENGLLTTSPITPPSTLNRSDDHRERSPSISGSIASAGTTSLSSAISEELKKRKERLNQNVGQNTSIDEKMANLKIKQQENLGQNGNSSLNRKDVRHDALMNEFKAAHRRMFRNGFNETQ